jgi:putative ABC transport system permease protein
MKIDYFGMAFRNLKSRRLRTVLTLLGIFIGACAVIALLSIGDGIKERVMIEFEKIGTDKIIIIPGSTGIIPRGSGYASLNGNDLDTIKKVTGVKEAAGSLYKVDFVEYRGERKPSLVIGMPQDDSKEIFEQVASFNVIDGKNLKSGDKYTALVGCLNVIDEENFKKGISIGSDIYIKDIKFKVIGSIDCIGSRSEDTSVFIPLETANEIFENDNEELSMIVVQIGTNRVPETVAEEIKRVLRRRKGIKEGDENFSVQTSEELIEIFNSIFAVIQWTIIGLAAISLVVGGIGIANTMYTAVIERKREIGIMKAIGARNSDIIWLFLIESGFLGLTGGIMGIIFGVLIGKSVELIATATMGSGFLIAYFSPYAIIGMALFSFALGAIFGVWPARLAARMNAVDAIRKK